jgi:beta-glucanase (GH16 family)
MPASARAFVLCFVVACGGSRGPAEAPADALPIDAPAIDAPADDGPLPPTFTRDGVRYQRAWVEDFSDGLGAATVGDWTFPSNAAWLHPDNVAVADGALTLHLTRRGAQTVPSEYLGAEYDRTGEQLFGRFLTRMRPVAPPGVIASFFTGVFRFEGERMVETAEIDIEFVGTTRTVEFTVHWIDPAGVKKQSNAVVPLPFDASDGFRVYEIEWLADRVVWYADGVELYRFTDAAVLAELALPQEVKANTWVSTSVPWAGAFDPATLPLATTYDWMAAYRRAD